MDSKQVTTQRYVTLFTTRGDNGKNIAFSGTTWRELQGVLTQNGVSYQDMKAVVKETQNTLESPEATVPEGNFILFLLPVKTKSGGPNRDVVKEIIATFGDRAKAHFNKDRNYTQKSDADLGKLLTAWNKRGLKAPSTPVAATPKKVAPKVDTKKAAAKAVEKIKSSKKEESKAKQVQNTEPEIDNEALRKEADRLRNIIPGVRDY